MSTGDLLDEIADVASADVFARAGTPTRTMTSTQDWGWSEYASGRLSRRRERVEPIGLELAPDVDSLASLLRHIASQDATIRTAGVRGARGTGRAGCVDSVPRAGRFPLFHAEEVRREGIAMTLLDDADHSIGANGAAR